MDNLSNSRGALTLLKLLLLILGSSIGLFLSFSTSYLSAEDLMNGEAPLSMNGEAPLSMNGEAPLRVISEHGVELRISPELFALYAGLNALGYSVESRKKGEPLEAPEFHPLRVRVRTELEARARQGGFKNLDKFVSGNPVELEKYLAGTLPADEKKADLKKWNDTLNSINSELMNDPSIRGLYEKTAAEQRELAFQIIQQADKILLQAEKEYSLEKIKLDEKMVVFLSVLESQGASRALPLMGSKEHWVLGAGLKEAPVALAGHALQASFFKTVQTAMNSTPGYAKQFAGLRNKRTKYGYQNADRFLAENLGRAIAIQMEGGDDLLTERADQDGLIWVRNFLTVLEGTKGGLQISRILARAEPK